MARVMTILDTPASRPKPSGRMLADWPEPPTQAEEGEPEVVAEPRLMSEALNYMAPRKGIDAPGDFRSCSACAHFIPERAFHAATRGNRCSILGSFPVEPYANCYRFLPWPMGKPIEHVIEANALCCLNGSAASMSPITAGYCEDKDHNHQCRSCVHFDAIGDPDNPGPECEMFECLNSELPKIFNTPTKVDPNAGCSAWMEPPETEEDEYGM